MTCESCVKDVSGSLFKLGGIQRVDANLKDQLVSIEGTGSLKQPRTSFDDSEADGLVFQRPLLQ